MDLPELLAPADAAEVKGCTRQGIHAAMKRGRLNTYPAGRLRLVIVDDTFKEWQPKKTGGRAHASYQSKQSAQDEQNGA